MDIDTVLQRADVRAVVAVARETDGMFVMLTQPDDSTVAWISPGVTRLLGYEPDDVVGQPAWSFLHEDDARRAAQARTAAKAGLTSSGDYAVRHRDGHHVKMRRVAWLSGDVVVGVLVSPHTPVSVRPPLSDS